LLAALTAPVHAGNHGESDRPDSPGRPDRAGPTGEIEEESDGVIRVSGANRFLTAAALSRHTHPEGADDVFVATGGGFADALAGAPAAAAADAPVLFSPPGNLHGPVADRLVELAPETVTVLGGPAAVSPRIMERIESLLSDGGDGGVAVERLGGGDRFGTAVAVSEAAYPDPDEVNDVLLAIGGRFPDALAGGPLAASLGAPVLLATADMLPESTTAEPERLDPGTVTALGGPGAVTSRVAEQIAEALDGG
jgi:putative cell wall-binding protein